MAVVRGSYMPWSIVYRLMILSGLWISWILGGLYGLTLNFHYNLFKHSNT